MTSTTTTNASTTGEFDVESFEQKLTSLKDTQDGIQQMSAWCLQQRAFHKKIVSSWLNVLKQVRVEHRLTLFYLANDVIQYSKRKNYEFVESWGTALQKATTMVRDEKVRNKIFRIFKIWEQREIYSEEYLSDLNGLLSMNPVKKTQQTAIESSDEFQNSVLISNMRECVKLEKHTDKNFKNLPKAPNCDIETIKNNLKDRSHSDDAEKDIDEFVHALEVYIKSLKTEIRSRKSLINRIIQADTFYTNQRGEVKVVVNAYRNFGNRIKVVKKKLDEITPNLPSPIPSPDINAPSPEQDADIVLPDDQSNISMNMFKNSSNGYSSYMDGNLPFDINDFKRESPKKPKSSYGASTTDTQQIQVINNRSEQKADSNYNDFFKPNDDPYTPMDVPLPVAPPSNYGSLNQPPTGSGAYSNNPIVSGGYSNNAPPSSSYGNAYDDSTYTAASTNSSYETQMPLMPPPMPPLLGVAADDFNSTWDMDMTWTSINSNNSFNSSVDTPVSPPHFEREGVNPDLVEYMEGGIDDEIVPIQDVDHRQLHIPQASSVKMSLLSKEKGRTIDVDHRNLISLTGSPGPRSFENKKKSNSPPRLNPFKKQSEIDKDYRRQASVGDIDYRTPNFQQQQQQQLQGRMQILQEIPTDMKSTNIQDVIKEIRTTVALQQQQAAGTKEAKSNSTNVTESLSSQSNPSKDNIVSKNSGNEKQETKFKLSEPPPPGTLHPPPPLPALDTSLFPTLNTFLTPPPPVFNSSLTGEICVSKEGNATVATVTTSKKCGRDNVESIDMDMSDEDLDEQKKVAAMMENELSEIAAELDSVEDESTLIQPQTNQRPPLLQTPDIQQWSRPSSASMSSTESGGGSGDMSNEMLPMMWKPRMAGTPPFRMPPTAIQQQPQFPRPPFLQSPRGFNPQMKQNFRDQMYMGGIGGGARNPPYFNNRGGRYGGSGRSRPHRGGFRGPNWQ